MTVITPVRSRCSAELVDGIRAATGKHADWQQTAQLVARALKQNLPDPRILTDAERQGDPDDYQCHILHVEPDGSFSVTAMVWRPGQRSPIHDHVAWCVFGVVQGAEHEELYSFDGDRLRLVGRNRNAVGDVSGFAPPGDIHRVTCDSRDVTISINIYGADITRLGSSVRRVYDTPVATTS